MVKVSILQKKSRAARIAALGKNHAIGIVAPKDWARPPNGGAVNQASNTANLLGKRKLIALTLSLKISDEQVSKDRLVKCGQKAPRGC